MGTTLKIFDLLSIVLSALVLGVFWGPWLALSRSISTFTAEVFLAVVHRMDRNLSSVMTVLMPVALLSTIPVLFISYHERDGTFLLTMAGFGLFVLTLIVTGLVEVPIVTRIRPWTISTLPGNWQQLRDRWVRFHIIRVAGGIAGLTLLVAGAIFQNG